MTDRGASLLSLKKTAEYLGYRVEAMRVRFEELTVYLRQDRRYAILHLGNTHYIAAIGVTTEGLIKLSEGIDIEEADEGTLSEMDWDGVALIIDGSARTVKPYEFSPQIIDLGRVTIGTRVPFNDKIGGLVQYYPPLEEWRSQ